MHINLFRALLLATFLFLAACGSPQQTAASISGTELAAQLAAGNAPMVLDVRTPGEYAEGHLPGAVNIPHDTLAERLDELGADHDRPIVVHCKSGRRADMAMNELTAAGFTNLRELDGHMNAWEAAGLPLE